MKHLLYHSLGSVDKNVKKHQLVAVLYGRNIDDVSDALIKDVSDELAGSTEYEKCKTNAYAPEPIDDSQRVGRYQYEMTGIDYLPHGAKNILIDFSIMEATE